MGTEGYVPIFLRLNQKYTAAGMYFTYTLILGLGLLLTLPYYIVRFRKYLPTLPDRLGFPSLPPLQHAVWVHAVSVGEVKAVEKLVERLRGQFPGKPLLVSTATPTGQQLARERRDIIDHTFYFPIDLPFCVRRAVDRVNPQMVIIAETEIWPNFLRICRSKQIPVVMINGRISDKSFPRYRLVRRWLRRVFADYMILGMQSEMDRKRIEEIGADPQKVTVFGNLKYDVVGSSRVLDATLAKLLQSWSLAPRHANRFDQVEELVKQRGLGCVRRTRLVERTAGLKPGGYIHQILLLDTIGELAAAFQYATVVFMGGSLVPKGGHNVLEPARHQKPIIFGPHMENFRDMACLFLDAKAAVQIQNAAELAPAVERLLADPHHASELGRRARAIVEQNTGATDRVLRFLRPVEAGR
ncbi:MAG: hypothetical protein DMG12_11850 [Acidobacteria bacterium]|nr:MAG: hypothetical protein DMG12_11850 [Acidobacteriota bacterium]